MQYTAISFSLKKSGIAFQSIEVSDSPTTMRVQVSNVPTPVMEIAEEALTGLEVSRMELCRPGDRPNIIYNDICIRSAVLEEDKLVLTIDKG